MPSTFRIPKAEIRGLYGRALAAYARRTYGQLPDNAYVYWHHRKALRAVLSFESRVAKFDSLDANLKSYAQLIAIEQAEPGSLEWPATKEVEVGATFRSDRPSYAEIIRFASQQGTLPFNDPELIDCFCHD